MTIEDLRYFCMVAKYKNISRAAKALYISSSALSRHIASLETSLGVQLLTRDASSVDLTAAGEYVATRAPALIAAFDKFQDSVRQIQQEHTSSIVLACLPAYNRRLFSAFRNYSASLPEQRLLINPLQSYEIIDSVVSGETDAGITYEFEMKDCDELVKSALLFQERFAVLVDNNHPLGRMESVSISDLSKETLLPFFRPYPPNGDFFARLVAGRTVDQHRYALTTPAQIAMQVKAGNGIAVFPLSLCLEFGAGCVIVPIRDDDAVANVLGIWRDDDNANQYERLFSTLANLLAQENT